MPSRITQLVILHTNDIHSHFGQMPKIATAFRELKKNRPGAFFITVDGGDHMDRMAVETEGSMGRANIAVMNATGYDLAVPGNNEGLTLPMEDLAALYGQQANFPLVCCNMAENATGRAPEWMHPSWIKEMGGLRVGFTGATAFFPDFYSLLGWDVREPLTALAEQIGVLRDQVDILVVVSHLGLANDERMAREIGGIDLILGAHTHHLLEQPIRVGSTLIAAAGKFGQYVGEIEFMYDSETGQLAGVSGKVLSADEFEPDDEVAGLIRNYRQDSKQKLNKNLIALREPLDVDWKTESRLGNLLAGGLRRWVEADIGIVNAGQLLGGLDEGPVTREKLLSLCPSPINPCFMLLKGEHLLLALEQSLLPEYADKPIFGFGFRGKVLGTLCVDGLTVEYDPNAPQLHRITSVRVGNSPIDPDREYKVGSIDMFTFRVGYPSLGLGRDIRYALPEFLRDVLEKELKEPGRIEASGVRRFVTSYN